MRDEEQAHAVPGLQVLQQIQNLRLYGHIKGCRRFVGNEEVRIVGQGHRDHDTLPLPSRQQMGVGFEATSGIVDSGALKQFDNALPCLCAGQILVQRKTLADLFFKRVQRVEGNHGLLENEADVVSPQVPQNFRVGTNRFLVLVGNRAGDFGILRQQTDRRKGGD